MPEGLDVTEGWFRGGANLVSRCGLQKGERRGQKLSRVSKQDVLTRVVKHGRQQSRQARRDGNSLQIRAV